IYAPNAFTPDGDGLNEDFRPVLNGFENWRYQFLVFDRWGELIHQSRDRGTAWNGSYKGKPVKSDVYVWKVVLNREGDERVYYGHITVVRGTE
ncbi:MAG: T9SS type B sorting domain-containing protein, partial [Flavobacteriales bacterium]|nr:T9SS type B sorting domain-containing protein [Flavobacteriales bacterium]